MRKKIDEIPFLIDPRVLRALGVDPDLYLKNLGSGFGWVLDRKRDAALIGRLQAMREEHKTVQ